jgi:hypothetical protein
MRLLCDFLGVTYNPRMTGDIAPRPPAMHDRLDVDERIGTLCDELHKRLDRELASRLEEDALGGRVTPVERTKQTTSRGSPDGR